MTRKRISVRKIKDLLRLHFDEKLGNRAVGESIRVSPSSVSDCLHRFNASGLAWPLDDSIDDAGLEERLYKKKGDGLKQNGSGDDHVLPDFEYIHKELSRKHTTLALLWEEYRSAHKEKAYQYSHFCTLYGEWKKPLGAVMRQRHKAGDKTFVDWSGDGVKIVNRETGEVWEAPLFVAVLGASSFTFVKAAPSRESASWLRMHVEMFEYFGGVTAAVVPDNEKTGVTSPCLYDPDLNRTYAAWAEHTGCAVIPTRPRKPRDKAKVETAVLIAQRWILAALRNHTFFSLEVANMEIARLLEIFNARLMQKMKVSRRELYETIDKPALRPLPSTPFEPFEWSSQTLNIDHHVLLKEHYYSAPHNLIGEKLEMRWTASTVELFHEGRRIASHAKSYVKWGVTTVDEHRQKKHREYYAWPPERLIAWARTTGPKTAELVETIIHSKRHPEAGYRASLGVIRLGKSHGLGRLEAACARALEIKSPSYRTVASILKTGADRLPLPGQLDLPDPNPLPCHENIRGPKHYH